MFAPIEPWISGADLAICQMEGTLTPTNTGLSYYPRFVLPHELAAAVAGAGYDVCSTASNHSMDAGKQGIDRTIDLLEAAGVAVTGTARTPEERLPNLYEVNGVTVGHMAFTYSTNGIPTGEPWVVNVIDVDQILADAAWARSQGAEFIILSMHWGAEYRPQPISYQTRLAEELLASPDIDIILGHHAHVVQPIDRIGGEVVVYGMSNQISNIRGKGDGSRSGAEDGVVVHLEVTEQADGTFDVTEVTYTPTWVDPSTFEILPVAHALATGRGPADTLQRSYQRTVDRITMLGVEDVSVSRTPWPEASCHGRAATIVGTAGDDTLVGTPGPDVIAAGGGNDTIDGGDGDDLVCGGDGDDLLTGGAGEDRLLGEAGNDVAYGNEGDDELWGGEGADRLLGVSGADLLVGGVGDDQLRGGDGDDVLLAGDGQDRADGGAGADRCVAVISSIRCE
jgi:poly-gamma-glutamate synthesis protein (capsule biosynthesis protein)